MSDVVSHSCTHAASKGSPASTRSGGTGSLDDIANKESLPPAYNN